MDPRRAADSRAVLVRWMNIADANAAGFVHGGTQTRRRNRPAERDEIRVGREEEAAAGAKAPAVRLEAPTPPA